MFLLWHVFVGLILLAGGLGFFFVLGQLQAFFETQDEEKSQDNRAPREDLQRSLTHSNPAPTTVRPPPPVWVPVVPPESFTKTSNDLPNVSDSENACYPPQTAPDSLLTFSLVSEPHPAGSVEHTEIDATKFAPYRKNYPLLVDDNSSFLQGKPKPKVKKKVTKKKTTKTKPKKK